MMRLLRCRAWRFIARLGELDLEAPGVKNRERVTDTGVGNRCGMQLKEKQMKRKTAKVLVPITTLALAAAANADSTISQRITQLQYDATNNNLYLKGTGKWSAAGCPNATYILITGDTSSRKELLGIILAAKAAGQDIQFAGSCYSDPDYFKANYLFID